MKIKIKETLKYRCRGYKTCSQKKECQCGQPHYFDTSLCHIDTDLIETFSELNDCVHDPIIKKTKRLK